MSLSLRDAAAEVPDRLALVLDGEPFTYAALAERVEAVKVPPEGAPLPLVCRVGLDALVTVYAALERRRPLLLIHPKLPPSEQEALARAGREFRPRADGSEESALALLFTSGTTGRPKAVELSRRAFAASAAAHAATVGWSDGDRWLLALSFAHVGGLSILTRCLLARRTVVAISRPTVFSPDATLEVLRSQGVTLCSLVPTQLAALVAAGPPPPSLRAVLLGGAAARPALIALATEAGWPVLTTYGLTETCSQVATQRPGTAAAGVGPALPGVELRVRDGAIEVRGHCLFTAYHGAPTPPRPEGWFTTGDLGRMDEAGTLHVLGRRDDVIVTGGEKVLPQLVEEALERAPGVAQACVFPVADETWGQLVAAAIVPRGTLDLPLLAEELWRTLAPFQRPRRVAIVDQLPTTAAGKVDRQAMATFSATRLRPLPAPE